MQAWPDCGGGRLHRGGSAKSNEGQEGRDRRGKPPSSTWWSASSDRPGRGVDEESVGARRSRYASS